MSVPAFSKYTDIEKCDNLVHEESCYGWIAYCKMSSWGKKAPCKEEVKQECLRCHHSTA